MRAYATWPVTDAEIDPASVAEKLPSQADYIRRDMRAAPGRAETAQQAQGEARANGAQRAIAHLFSFLKAA